jgi:putative ABC transport system permease protein
MSTFIQDVKFGVRMLLKTPVVSAVAALSLALGIAANTGMFSLLDGFVFAPLPYADQHELVVLRESREGERIDLSSVSAANFRDYVEASRSFESAMAYTVETANLTGLDVPEQLNMVVSTPEIFDVLGVPPALGRGFRAEEGAEGLGDVVVLEHDYWQTRFFGDRETLGRTLVLDGRPYTVVGVTPADFDMVPANVHAFRPSDFSDRMEQRGVHGLLGFARLRAGVTREQAEAELRGVSDRLAAEFPDAKRGWDLRLLPLREFFPGETDRKLMMILTAVTLFGLLIACANVANLLLGRAEIRQKEVAVRTAMGAGRSRILRQLLTESVVLGLVAGALGVGLSVYLVEWIASAMPPEMPAAMVPTLGADVLTATVVVSILAGIVFGLVPAVHASSGDLREALGEGARGGTAGRRRKRIRNAFVVTEFAVALALLTGAGFLTQAFNALTDADPGFNPDGLLSLELSVLEDRYEGPDQIRSYERELLRALEGVPGVTDVAVMGSLPRSRGNPRAEYSVAGRDAPETGELPTADFQSVNPAYFSTLEIELRQGRLLEEGDREDAQPVAVVSEAFVRREFPGEDPLGKTIQVRGADRVVVGVVEDIMQDRITLAGRGGESIYVPIEQYPLSSPAFTLRTAGDPASLTADVRRAVWAVEADQPVARIRPLQAHIDESLAGPRAMSTFLTAIAAIALLLAALGIYGVMAHSVTQQRREIGIRMALGAGRGSVMRMVTRSGVGLAGLGMLFGLPLSWLMFRGVSSALNLFAADVGVGNVVWVTAALAGAAIVSTLLPARRASGVAPVTALRDE